MNDELEKDTTVTDAPEPQTEALPILTLEQKREATQKEIKELAAKVTAGEIQVVPISVILDEDTEFEEKILVIFKVPSLATENAIGARAALIAATENASGLDLDSLPRWENQLVRARATFELLLEGECPKWCPPDKNGRPNTASLRSPLRLMAVYNKWVEIQSRFR
jgi:hypothetical protein